MLRVAVPIVRLRPVGALAAAARSTCRVSAAAHTASPSSWRGFADIKKADEAVLPGSASKDAPSVVGVPQQPILESPTTGYSASVITPDKAPKLPEPPSPQASSRPPLPPPTNQSNTTTPPPPKPKKKRRFRRFLITTTTLLGLAYGGAVYYALINDDFHDYFTDYMPGGEDAVLFFEEREFKRRFPDGMGTRMYPQVSGENKVTITGRSGASARVAEKKDTKDVKTAAKDTTGAGKGAKEGGSATDPKLGTTDRAVAQPVGTPSTAPVKDAAKKTVEKVREATPSPPTVTSKPAAKESSDSTSATPAKAASSSAKITPIDPLSIANAADPAVQKVTTMLNDLITVINADEDSGKYTSSLAKAKDDLQKLANDIGAYKASQQAAAQDQIKKNDAEFDKVAKDMLARAQQEQKEQEMRWREEYENERKRISQTYDDKLKAELEAAHQVADQKRRNELLEQNIKLQDSFADTIRDQVETERDARLSKLNELSTTVSELERLTTQWNDIVDANIKSQHLVVAIDAVRTALETADRPTPFLHQLAALKETANNNGTVNAAIASIRPPAYQKGIPTPGQLIDRFRRVATEVRKASLLPEDAGVASHAASFVLSKVLFRKQGLTAGDDVESILTRTETLLEEGDLDEAAREMNGLTGWARVLSDDWLTDCRRVLEVRQAVEVMSTEAKLQSLMVE